MRRHDPQFKLILTYWKFEFLLQNNSFSNRCWFSSRWAKTIQDSESTHLLQPRVLLLTSPMDGSAHLGRSVGSWTLHSVISKALPLGCLRPSKDVPPAGKAHTVTPNHLNWYTSLPWCLFHTFASLCTSFPCFFSPTKWRLLEDRNCMPFTFWGSPKHAMWDGQEPCACSHL